MQASRIIIAENEVIIARDIRNTLVHMGYDVAAITGSGEEVITLAALAHPDLVLMDIRLDGIIDGISAAESIRNAFDVPIVFLTAYADDVTLRRAQRIEPYGYLIKPFSPEELRAAIQMALHRASAERERQRVARWMTTTLTSIGEAVIAATDAGHITFLNPIAEELTGWHFIDAIGKSLSEVLHMTHLEDGSSIDDWTTMPGPRPTMNRRSFNTRLHSRSGSSYVVEVRVAAMDSELEQSTGGGMVIVFRDVTERQRYEERLQFNALHDALTGLPNRALFSERLAFAIENLRCHSGERFAVLFLDLDRFKVVNDSLGHLVGDKLLIQLAQRLRSCLRNLDILARLGGDEFTILLDHADDATDAMRVATRIHKQLATPFQIDGHEIYTGVSIGIALSADYYGSPDEIMRDADLALYRAKAQGRRQTCVFDSALHAEAVTLLRLETDLRHALEREEFRVFYQPIVRLHNGELVGFEALLRWQHPERGLLSPADFLRVAEESGMFNTISTWMFDNICRQIQQWEQEVPLTSEFYVTLNLSPKQFLSSDLVERLIQTINNYQINPAHIGIEIIEDALMDPQVAREMPQRLRGIGMRVAIDDFGTGYSSLAALGQISLDTLKIDRAFVQPLVIPTEEPIIARTIILLAHELGLEVIAEGIENELMRKQLLALGCSFGQGFHFAPALAAVDARAWLYRHCKSWMVNDVEKVMGDG